MRERQSDMDRQAILKLECICKYFGGNHAVEDVSFEVYPGEVVGLIGDNGAGKSTLIKMISGVYRPTHGSIYWMGQKLEETNPRVVRDRGIETIYQDLALADNLRVSSNLFLGRERMKRLLGIIEILDEKTMLARAAEILSRLDILIPDLRTTVRDLSGGQRQSIAIGKAIFWEAKLLIMDEPTAALGVGERTNILNLIKKLREQGVSVILISHNLTDVFAVTDRLVVLRRGVKIRELLTRETSESELVQLMIGSAN
jgi:ABC-type sugar transport system ATPase subunit